MELIRYDHPEDLRGHHYRSVFFENAIQVCIATPSPCALSIVSHSFAR